MQVELFEFGGTGAEGAKFGPIPRTTVTIANDDEYAEIMDNMIAMTEAQLSELSLYQSSWSKQIKTAMLVNGGNLDTATLPDYLMHFLTFGLKIIFSSCPPPGKGGGWPCFWVSLFYIGIMVVIIRYIPCHLLRANLVSGKLWINQMLLSDFAKIFGCLVGIKDEITAITLVTFGTSQIDLFASRIAAISDPSADNSIGNVVAANAIGVFLGRYENISYIYSLLYLIFVTHRYLHLFVSTGLGFPWLVASIYWEYYDPVQGFEVGSRAIIFQVSLLLCLFRHDQLTNFP